MDDRYREDVFGRHYRNHCTSLSDIEAELDGLADDWRERYDAEREKQHGMDMITVETDNITVMFYDGKVPGVNALVKQRDHEKQISDVYDAFDADDRFWEDYIFKHFHDGFPRSL